MNPQGNRSSGSSDLGVCATEIGYRVQTTELLPQAASGDDLAEKMISIIFGS